MRRRLAACFVALLAIFGTTACAGGGNEQEIEALEERVEFLEEELAEIQLLLGTELAEEPQQEQTQP